MFICQWAQEIENSGGAHKIFFHIPNIYKFMPGYLKLKILFKANGKYFNNLKFVPISCVITTGTSRPPNQNKIKFKKNVMI